MKNHLHRYSTKESGDTVTFTCKKCGEVIETYREDNCAVAVRVFNDAGLEEVLQFPADMPIRGPLPKAKKARKKKVRND